MANKLYEENSIQAIADAIRAKNGTESTYTVAEMSGAILAISGSGGITPSGSVTITENGTVDVTQYAEAVVNVASGSGGVSIGAWQTGVFAIEEEEAGDTKHTVTHNLGFAPRYIVVWAEEYDDLTVHNGRASIGGHLLGNVQGHLRKTADDTTVSYSAVEMISNVTETTFDFGGAGAMYVRPAGWHYRWLALA